VRVALHRKLVRGADDPGANVDSPDDAPAGIAARMAAGAPAATDATARESAQYPAGGSARGRSLGPLWLEVAALAGDDEFDPAAPGLQASFAYTQAQAWQAAARSVAAEPGWADHGALRARLAEACARQGELHAARVHWSWLCWRHPEDAARALPRAAGDARLRRLWSEFLDADHDLGTEDFPAWQLLADPAQSRLRPPSGAPEDECGRAYAASHGVVARGGDIEARAALRAVRPELLEVHLARKRQPRSPCVGAASAPRLRGLGGPPTNPAPIQPRCPHASQIAEIAHQAADVL
jgi:hypothetical protein